MEELKNVEDMTTEELTDELIFPKPNPKLRNCPKKQVARSRQQLHAYLKLCKELYSK